MYATKKSIDNPNIIIKNLTNLKIDLKSDLIKNLIKKLLNIWLISKKIWFSPNNNIDNKDLNKMKVLIINIQLPLFIVFNIKNSKFIFSLLGFIEKAKKIITNFTNRLFNHIFIIIGNILFCNITLINTNCNNID